VFCTFISVLSIVYVQFIVFNFVLSWYVAQALSKLVFLNRQAAALYRALASIITGHERFSWNLSFFTNKYFIVEIF